MPNQSKHIGSFHSKVDTTDHKKGKNYLFVIAIDEYENCPKLYNPVKDANDLVNLLSKKYHFENQNIITLLNDEANEANIIHTFRDIARSLTPQDNLVIFFSGHGEYDEVFKEGYWIPANAGKGSIEDYIENSKIRTILNAISSHHTFLIADSCFSGSLFTTGKDVASNRLEKDPSRWGLTAGRNEIVDDGKPGNNSPFADSLIYHLKNNDKPIGVMELCQKVIEDVVANAAQTPRGEPLKVEGHRGGQFFFEPYQMASKGIMSESKPDRQHGSLLHNIPEEMEKGRDTRCEVRIAYEKETLLKDLPKDAEIEIMDIRVSNLMEVDLLDPASDKAFEVRTFSQKEQFIEEDEYTQWVFYVKPLKSGTYPLLLKVSVIEYLHGKERKRDIILEEKVQIVTEIPETAEIVSGYKSATVNFHPSMPSQPKMEAESIPPRVPRAPSPSSIFVERTSKSFEPSIGETSHFPSPTKKKSMRGRITQIAGILVILLAAIMILPNVFTGDESVINPSDNPDPIGNKGGSIDLDNKPPEIIMPASKKIIGKWEVLEFQQNGTPTPMPKGAKMSYNFDGQNALFSFQNENVSAPYRIEGQTIFWGENVGEITFIKSNQAVIEGTNQVGSFKMVLQRLNK